MDNAGRRRRRTGMPNVRVFDLDERDTKEILVDFEDSGDDDINGEVFFDFGVVEGQRLRNDTHQ